MISAVAFTTVLPMKTLEAKGQACRECATTIVRKQQRKGAKAMLGYASTFRKPRTTTEWTAEIREGEER